MSKRKFYRTVIQIEILSDEPYAGVDLEGINYDITDGHCSGRLTDIIRDEVKTGVEMAKLLQEQGSNPEFFSLTDDGQDKEDEE